MPPKKDQAPIYIDGPKMDWSMDEGLYSCFQDWKLECELILDGELTEIAEPRKVNTLRPTASCTQMSCKLGTNCSNS